MRPTLSARTRAGQLRSSPKPAGILGHRTAKWAILVVSLGASVVLSEIVVRLIEPQQLQVFEPEVYQARATYGWAHTANLHTKVNTGERAVRLITDAEGHRVGLTTNPEADVQILALGDSFIEALQVEHEASLSGLLEIAVGQDLGQTVRVINTGVAGWSPNHYLMKAREQLRSRSIDAVVVVLFLGNDILRARETSFPEGAPIITHDFEWPRALTAGALFESFLYPLNDRLERGSHLFVMARSRVPGLRTRVLDAIRVSLAGPDTLLTDSVTHVEQTDSYRWRLTAEVCSEIAAEAARNGAPTFFALVPRATWVDPPAFEALVRGRGGVPAEMDRHQPARRLREELEQLGLEVIDLSPMLEAAVRSNQDQIFGRVDTHLGPRGHRVAADLLVPRLLEALKAVDTP